MKVKTTSKGRPVERRSRRKKDYLICSGVNEVSKSNNKVSKIDFKSIFYIWNYSSLSYLVLYEFYVRDINIYIKKQRTGKYCIFHI